MRIIADFRVPQQNEWQKEAQSTLEGALADFGIISPADSSDEMRIMDLITADMSEGDLANFKRSVRYLAREFAGPVASVNVLRDGYVRLRLRSVEFEGLYAAGQAVIVDVMKRYGPGTTYGWELKRCEIRERGGGRGFLYGAWIPGVQSFNRYLFLERRAIFIAVLFAMGLLLESVLSFVPAEGNSLLAGTAELGLRLGAPMLISSTVLIIERYAQWLDQRSPRLLWSARPKQVGLQRQSIEP